MADFRQRIGIIAGHPPSPMRTIVHQDTFLSNELRIPITLVGTYAGRALRPCRPGPRLVNYSSDTFKGLDPVWPIRYFIPYASEPSAVSWTRTGRTRVLRSPNGTRAGYFPSATLVSIWQRSFLFTNNALGIYTHIQRQGPMLAFDDASASCSGRSSARATAARTQRARKHLRPPGDCGPKERRGRQRSRLYNRLPVDTRVQFQPAFILSSSGIAAGSSVGPAWYSLPPS